MASRPGSAEANATPALRRRGGAARLGHEAGGHFWPSQGKLAGARGARETGKGRKVARQGGEEEEVAFHGGRARRRHGRRWRGSRRRYLGSAGGTGASTTCWRATRSCGHTIAGRGGGDAVDFAGGCGGAARGRVRALGACGEERQRGSEPASAPAPAEVGGRVGAGAGWL